MSAPGAAATWSHPGSRGRFSVRVPHAGAGDTRGHRRRPQDPRLRAPARLAAPLAPARERPQARPGAPLAGRRESTADVGVYVHRADGDAAAWNAGAEFEGASTLKLPIMVAALERIGGEPRATAYWSPFTAITRSSSNEAADEALELLGGSEVDGAADMVAAMRRLGLRHTYMYGGYLTEPGVGGGPPPERTDRRAAAVVQVHDRRRHGPPGRVARRRCRRLGPAHPPRREPPRGARAALPHAPRRRPGARRARARPAGPSPTRSGGSRRRATTSPSSSRGTARSSSRSTRRAPSTRRSTRSVERPRGRRSRGASRGRRASARASTGTAPATRGSRCSATASGTRPTP